jgi:two-component system, chemotaxis family, protein-glutamate methylesterase/glutaminase
MKIKLLITDDSAFMRTAVRLMLKDDPQIEIVGEARDGETAITMAGSLKPDVITMDVEMSGMNGVEATRIIMKRSPCPIIMLSSLTDRGAVTTLKALEAGAVDFIPKKSSFVQLDIVQIGNELHEKVRFWGERHLLGAIGRMKGQEVEPAIILPALPRSYQPGLVVIGVSTGGPAIIPNLLASMGNLKYPVVIAQHMPALFTEGFARHLRLSSGLNVVQAHDGMTLEPGIVAICPGGTDTILREPLPGRIITVIKHDETALIHPSIDQLFESAARLSCNTAAIIMTGMGKDGTRGARVLAGRGCPILAQEPAECTVDGMPGSVIESGVVNEVLRVAGLGRRLRMWNGAPY